MRFVEDDERAGAREFFEVHAFLESGRRVQQFSHDVGVEISEFYHLGRPPQGRIPFLQDADLSTDERAKVHVFVGN